MSRRPDTKAAQNLATIKSLLKVETNKVCADCKKSKHPRWASWNLGVFICIRCSGIHRGMGTHISRVKSVDLDAWTDEQLQSIVRWGNMRANKYWEAKLAPGHVPSDAKIENFIRTKYESKRWVMDGPIPDPSTLGDDGGADDNVPLNVVREKAQLDRASSQGGTPTSSARGPAPAGRTQPAQFFDLMSSDDPEPPPPRPSTTDTPGSAARAPPPPKPTTPSQLLGGLDFLGGEPERPSSSGQKPGGMSRPDLKQSILSLYAAPKPQAQSPPTTQSPHDRQPSFGGMTSPPAGGSSSSGLGGMNDAFAGLSFGASSSTSSKPPQQQQAGMSAFGGLGQTSPPVQGNPAPPQQSGMSSFGGLGQTSPPVKANPAPPQMSSPPLSGGGFFDAGPKPPPKPSQPKPAQGPSLAVRKTSNVSDGFGDFSASTNPAPKATSPTNAANNAGLLDFTQTMVNIQPVQTNTANQSSVFNLSSQQKSPPTQAPAPSGQINYASKVSTDPWGSNEWASPEPVSAQKKPSISSPPMSSGTGDFGWGSSGGTGSTSMQNAWSQPASSGAFSANTAGGWGDEGGFGAGTSSSASQPKIAAEEDFGGWGTSNATEPSPAKPTSAELPKFGGNDDLFSNVWG